MSAHDFTPGRRRPPRKGEYEVRKGIGGHAKWFYVNSMRRAELLLRLCRNYGFPASITREGPK